MSAISATNKKIACVLAFLLFAELRSPHHRVLTDLQLRDFDLEPASTKGLLGSLAKSQATTLCNEGSEVEFPFPKDGTYYKCLDRSADKIDDLYESQHNYLPASDILLLNQPLGSVARICEGEMNHDDDDGNLMWRCLLPTGNETAQLNSPMPLRVSSWMRHPYFRGQSINLYYSSHTTHAIGLLSLDSSTRMWKKSDATLTFGTNPCQTLHSPSIFVNDQQERLYMYVHGHHCKNPPSGVKNFQPTLLFISKDGVSWELQDKLVQNPPYLLWDLFYLSNPIYNVQDGYYYAMARIREGESVVLCRSTSLDGPFEEGPKLGRSIRHFDLFQVGGNIYVLFSMYGDRPERILLGSIDTTLSTNWSDWKLLPGPRILQPEYWYEHGNAGVVTSKPGMAQSRHRISDPRILLDDRDLSSAKISGVMFYSVQGEKGIAAARISIDLDLYHYVTHYRDHTNIRPDVLSSTSLAKNDEESTNETSTELTPLLVTGVGRTGTTGMCTLLRKIGIMVSHDNSVDCGPYPGLDGAVSWYDAFKSPRRYEHVIHMVRDPLKTMNSRIAKCQVKEKTIKFLKAKVKPYEVYSRNDTCSSYAIKNWVRRNSFVESHASWRSRTESIFSEPLSLWEMCMAANFGDQCPELSLIESQLKSMPSNLNSLYSGATVSKFQKKKRVETGLNDTGHESWESLANAVGRENAKYIQIAQTMARRYGYDTSDGFAPVDFFCKFTGKVKRKDKNSDKGWDCFITGTGST